MVSGRFVQPQTRPVREYPLYAAFFIVYVALCVFGFLSDRTDSVYLRCTRIFWTMGLPLLPFFMVAFGYYVWRRACPLSMFAKLGTWLRPNRRRAGPWLEKWSYAVIFAGMILSLEARLLFTNGSGVFLSLFLIAIAVAAFLTGILFTGKTWCNFVCPVGLIEKIYLEPAGMGNEAKGRNSMCRPCTGCKRHCPDIDVEMGYWKERDNLSRRLTTYAWPGVVFGFYWAYWTYSGTWDYYFSGVWTRQPDEWRNALAPGFFFAPQVPKWAASLASLLVPGIATLIVFLGLERLLAWRLGLARARDIAFAIAAYSAFNIFYIFAGAPTWAQIPGGTRVIASVAVALGTWFLVRRLGWSESAEIEARYARRYDAAVLADAETTPQERREILTWTIGFVALSAFSMLVGVAVASAIKGVDRDANAEPVFALTPSTVQSDRVPLSYTLKHAPRTLDVEVEYSTDGPEGAFQPATEALGSPSEGTKDLRASEEGAAHVFVWNAFYDLDARGITNTQTVVVRIRALRDAKRLGLAGQTRSFTVDDRLLCAVVGSPGLEIEGTSVLSVPLVAPSAAIVNAQGCLLVSDTGSARIRYGDRTSGVASTYAGGGVAGWKGDGGPAVAAKLSAPKGLALDADGALVVADSGNHRLRRVDASGIVTTIAGVGSAGYSGDGGAALSAALNRPTGVAIDEHGTIFFTDAASHVVRAIDRQGTIRTIAGNGTAGFAGDNGPATQAQLSSPHGLCLDPATGTIYVADTDNHAVRAIAKGRITTVAGTLGRPGRGEESAAAKGSLLHLPEGVCLGDDAVYVSDTGNNRIRRFKPGAAIETVAGSLAGEAGFMGDNGRAANALLSAPGLLSSDGAGGVLIADPGNNRIRHLSAAGVITTVMGSGAASRSNVGDGGPATEARLSLPYALARGPDGTLYVADAFAYRVRGFQVGGSMTTFAGTGISGTTVQGGPAVQARLSIPRGVAVDDAGVVFIANSSAGTIAAVNPIQETIALVVGGGSGPDGATSFSFPHRCLALKPVPGKPRVLLISELNGHQIRRLQYEYDAATGAITSATTDRVCGIGKGGFSGDGGPALKAAIEGPQGLAAIDSGEIVFADSANHVLRAFALPDPNGKPGAIRTIAGVPSKAGFSGDGGPATAAQLNTPVDVAFDPTSRALYVSDQVNNRVRRIDAQGTITTAAGDGEPGDEGLGGPATKANVTSPQGLVVDPKDGSLVVVASGTQRVLRVDPSGKIESVAGVGPAGSVGDGGPATAGVLGQPSTIDVGADGTLYVLDQTLNRLRRVDPRTRTITTVAGDGVLATTGEGGPAIKAALAQPRGVQVDREGCVYISERATDRIRKIEKDGTIRTIVGDAARIKDVQAIALSPVSSSLYLAETGRGHIRRVDLATGVIERVAGGGSLAGEDVPALDASIVRPIDMTVDSKDAIYVVEASRNRVRKIEKGNIATIAGVLGQTGYNGDKIPARQAYLSSPGGVAVDSLGYVYIADSGNHRIRRVDPSGFITTVVNESGQMGCGPDRVVPYVGKLIHPLHIAVDARRNIYVADSQAGVVYRFRPFP